MLRTFALAGLLALGWVAPAAAGVARVASGGSDRHGPLPPQLVFEAAPGERNAITAAPAPDGTWTIVDTGAPLAPGPGCTAPAPGRVRCATAVGVLARFVTGDLDDAVTAPGDIRVEVDAGTGDDVLIGAGRLSGGPGRDVVEGSPGTDELYGGPGPDVVRGGEGSDSLSGDASAGAPEALLADDTLDGGEGADFVTYEQRMLPVAVDLADPAPDGSAGERDTLVGIEGVTGGTAGDRLAGSAGSDELRGGLGDDRISGRAGDDRLDDGPGVDTLLGGEGDDVVPAGSAGDRALGEAGADMLSGVSGAILDAGEGDDRVVLYAVILRQIVRSLPARPACGLGEDTVTGTVAGPRLDDCENVAPAIFSQVVAGVAPRLSRADRSVSVPVRCVAAVRNGRGCRGTVTVRLRRPGAPPVTLGRASFSLARGAQRTVRARVTMRGRRALRGRARPLLEPRVSGATIVRPKHRAPGGVDTTLRLDARWRVRVARTR